MKTANLLALLSVVVGSSQTLVMAQTTEAQAFAAQKVSRDQLLDLNSKIQSGIKKALLAPEMQGVKLVTVQKNGKVEDASFHNLVTQSGDKEYAMVTPVIPEANNRAFGVKTTVRSLSGTDQISFSIRVKSADFRTDYAGRVIKIDLKDINQTQAIMEDNIRSLSFQVAKKAGFAMNQKSTKTFAQKLWNGFIPSAEASPAHDNIFTRVIMGVVFIGGLVTFGVGVMVILENSKSLIKDVKYLFSKGISIREKGDDALFVGGGAVVMVAAAYAMYAGLKSVFDF